MLKPTNFKKSRNQLEGYVPGMQGEKPSIPQRLYTKCPMCEKLQLTDELTAQNGVCPHCGHHFRLSARSRIRMICDEDSFIEWDASLQSKDPLQFPGYAAKIKAGRLKIRENDAVVTGEGAIGGRRAALFVMDGGFMMGSMGSVVGEKITRVFERAIKKRLPVVGFTVSGGARMQEGMYSLMQMAKTSGAVKKHSDAGLLYIAVLTDPTTGGVTASFAMEGDILIGEPGALIGFAGPRVIEQTIRQKLPDGFQKAEFLLEKGFLDMVTPRARMKETLAALLALHTPRREA